MIDLKDLEIIELKEKLKQAETQIAILCRWYAESELNKEIAK